MPFQRPISFLLLMVATLLPAHAEDIDLFTGGPTAPAAASNLLIVIDNAANFSSSTTMAGSTCTLAGATNSLAGTVGGVEQCVLHSVISALPASVTASLSVGIMVYNGPNVVDYNGVPCPSSAVGGCLVYPLTGVTTATKASLLSYIRNWKTSNGGAGTRWLKASSQATGAAMQEAWAYYAGRRGLSGFSYASIAPSTNCKNFLLFLSNATSSPTTPGDAPDSLGPQTALEGTNVNPGMNAYPPATDSQKQLISKTSVDQATACGTLASMPSNHNNAGYYADEWSRYMRGGNLRITSYSIALLQPGSCKPDIPWLLASIAAWGGGKYFATTDASSLNTALTTVFSEVRSVNSVFAAVSLPVSTVNQSNFLNQIFIGMFRPDPDGNPRWFGNLKQYRADLVNGVLQTVDADGASAVSANGSEFIASCARSYWTPTATATGDGYWTDYSDANCTGYPATSNSPDGQIVEKGGQGYLLRAGSPANRFLTTCSPSFASCTTLTQFSTANSALTAALFGVPDASLANLINWSRGANNATPGEHGSLNGASITASNYRPSVHGGVVHSRPAAFNFGTDTDRKVIVLYGGDDGVFRAINGNRTSTFSVSGAPVGPGQEFWAFVPPESYPTLSRLFTNSPIVSASNPKPYGMDGPIASYKASNGDGWLFAGMRRGGRALYSFKIDASTLAVSLRWKRGCGDSTTANCTNDSANGDWRNIGQTWAAPHVFTTPLAGAANPLVIMGGGYDAACEDTISYGACANPVGNRLYVFDATNGSLTRTFTTTRSVTADVTVATDANGDAAYIYAVDLAGNIYRVSGPLTGSGYAPMGSHPPSDWVITTVAALGCDTGTSCATPPNRKLMFAPEVVFDGTSFLVLVGSGDREKPTNTSNATTNYFFAVRDRPDLGSAYLADTGNCGGGATALCLSSLYAFDAGTTPTAAQLAGKPAGYAIRMRQNEQVITAATSVFGNVYYSTHLPKPIASNSCSVNLGDLTPRSFNYADASGTDVFVTRSDAGLSPDPVVGKLMLDDGSVVPVCIGCQGPLQTTLLPGPASFSNPAKIRSYWYLRK